VVIIPTPDSLPSRQRRRWCPGTLPTRGSHRYTWQTLRWRRMKLSASCAKMAARRVMNWKLKGS